jgi:5-hydroxyisourate hydrolase
MSAITTHILDTAVGKPGEGIIVRLEHKSHNHGWQVIGEGVTNTDGRVNDLLSLQHVFETGHYRLIFETGPYFLQNGTEGFFPQIIISFVVKDASQHYHVPLLMSRFGYTTYRGS